MNLICLTHSDALHWIIGTVETEGRRKTAEKRSTELKNKKSKINLNLFPLHTHCITQGDKHSTRNKNGGR